MIWHGRNCAQLNAIRNRTLIEQGDLAVSRFSEKYKQSNATFGVGNAAALGSA